MANTPDPGRDTASFKIADRTVVFREPTAGQMFVVLGMADLAHEQDDQLKAEACLNFGTVIKTCFVQPDDRAYVMHGLASGSIELEDFFSLAIEMVQHWAPEAGGQNREARRAAPRKAPAKKVASRVRNR
jgi:hypothetical protein